MRKIFLLVVVLVIAFALFMLLKKKSAEEPVTAVIELPATVLPLSVDDVYALQVIGMHAEYSLQRVSNEFQMLGVPDIERMDQDAILALLTAVTELAPVEVIADTRTDEELNLASYTRFTVTSRTGSVHELRIADQPLIDGSYAVSLRADGDTALQRYRIKGESYPPVKRTQEQLLKP